MNPLKLIKKKNFYSQEKINSIDFQEIEEKGGKLFKKVYKKIKWEKIDYTEISSDTFDDINWKFVNFKKAVKSKTFDIDKIDFEEAELSKTFKFLDKKNSVKSGGTSNSTTSKGSSDSSLYKQWGPYQNDEVVEDILYESSPDSYENAMSKTEFNDEYFVRYQSREEESGFIRGLTINRGNFKYTGGGSAILDQYSQEDGIVIRLFGCKSGFCNDNSFIQRLGSDGIKIESNSDWGVQTDDVSVDDIFSSSIYKKIANSPEYSQFFEDDQWYLQTADQVDFL